MYTVKCPVCASSHTSKNGHRNGRQLFKCRDCGHQFRNIQQVSDHILWEGYMSRKQTVKELASEHKMSESTVKRRLRNIAKEWVQPPLSGSGFVHMDATYWGRNSGILLAVDSATGFPLYLSFIKHEKVCDYVAAIESIESRGYEIRGIVMDGMKHVFHELSSYNIQMCQFHLRQIVRRYVTLHPKLLAARELNELMARLTKMSGDDFRQAFEDWKTKWDDTLKKRSRLKNGKTPYRHRRLRSAMNSIAFYMPYLFTFEKKECLGMPNTNNKIEGVFTDLKRNLNSHSGMTEENRKRFISGFFLALEEAIRMKKSRHQPNG